MEQTLIDMKTEMLDDFKRKSDYKLGEWILEKVMGIRHYKTREEFLKHCDEDKIVYPHFRNGGFAYPYLHYMGKHKPQELLFNVENLEHIKLMENHIDKNNMREEYVENLKFVLHIQENEPKDLFRLIHATAKDRAYAGLLLLRKKSKETE